MLYDADAENIRRTVAAIRKGERLRKRQLRRIMPGPCADFLSAMERINGPPSALPKENAGAVNSGVEQSRNKNSECEPE